MKTLTLDDEMPTTARRLWKTALEHDWQVWATSAEVEQGWRGKPCSSVAIRLRKGSVRLVAVWENGRFTSGLRQAPFGKLGARELMTVVTS